MAESVEPERLINPGGRQVGKSDTMRKRMSARMAQYMWRDVCRYLPYLTQEDKAQFLEEVTKLCASTGAHHAGVVAEHAATAGMGGEVTELLPDVGCQRGVVEGGLPEQ